MNILWFGSVLLVQLLGRVGAQEDAVCVLANF